MDTFEWDIAKENLHISSWKQFLESIPNAIKNNLMNDDQYYLYRLYHNYLLEWWYLDLPWDVIYPWIGPDISTPITLFGNKNIIWFDYLWLNNRGTRYDIEKLNKLLELYHDFDMKYDWPEELQITKFAFENDLTHYNKYAYWGYVTWGLSNWNNTLYLFYELLALWYQSTQLNFLSWREFWIQYLSILSWSDKLPNIKIYQTDVLKREWERSIGEVLDTNQSSYYLEKSGQMICRSFSTPLLHLLENSKDLVIAMTETPWNQIFSRNDSNLDILNTLFVQKKWIKRLQTPKWIDKVVMWWDKQLDENKYWWNLGIYHT